MYKLFSMLTLIVLVTACNPVCDCEEPEPEVTLECNTTYAGFWTANSNCTYDKIPYTLTFNESDDCDSTTLYNFLADGETISVGFNSMSLTIPEQKLDDRYNVYGQGFLNGDTLKFTFSKVDQVFGGSEILCELKATKQ